MVSSYRVSTWRIIICTPVISGEEDQEEKQNEQKPACRQAGSNLLIKTNKQFTHFLSHTKWVGGFVALFLLVITSVLPSEAHAADRSWGNIDLAKKVIDNVSPMISDNNPESASASLAFASDEFLQKPLVVETLVTKVEKPKQVVRKPKVVAGISTGAHSFPYGYCTYYVSSRRSIPWSGNAISWLYGARSYGFSTGDTPQVGAIIVTSEGGRAGHVGMVDAVNDDGTITITEMNYRGWGVVSSRTISSSYSPIMGYIY